MPEVSYKVCCPVCGHGRSHVTNVRHGEIDERAVTTYRRQCLGCTAFYDTESTERVIDLSHPTEPVRQVFHYLDLPIDASVDTVAAFLVADVPRRIDALR